MKKLIQGIVEFRRKVQKDYREALGRLAIEQMTDALFIACSDGRVVPNTFASTNPGDLFVIRNVGNLIPPCGKHGISDSDESEAAAIEFALHNLNISDIIVCGHSECGAMKALVAGKDMSKTPHLKHWIRHGEPALKRLESGVTLDSSLSKHNQLSQLNVLLQMEHILSYDVAKKRVEEGSLNIHGWWFDLAQADVYSYEEDIKKFVLIDEGEAERLLQRLDK